MQDREPVGKQKGDRNGDQVTASETQTLFHRLTEQRRRLCIRNEVGQTDELAVLPRKACISIASRRREKGQQDQGTTSQTQATRSDQCTR